jgi:uncharacterized membrane protein
MINLRTLALIFALLPSCAPDASDRADRGVLVNQPVTQSRSPNGQTEPARSDKPTAGACDTQEGRNMPNIRLRAVGTEPFWGARIQGRCVTYSHPEDQAGTRVWTKFSGTASSGSWTGALNGQPFSLRTAPETDCSDGMSDRRYPLAVSLSVMGEERRGCAEPL